MHELLIVDDDPAIRTLLMRALQDFGKVDVAMIPIGGTFTMPPDTAREVLHQLKPKIAIPMHYREDMSLIGMFLKGFPNRHLPGHTLLVTKMALPAQIEIVVLTPWRGGRRDHE